MEEVVVYISKDHLVSIDGKNWLTLLRDLQQAKVINSFENVIAIKFDRDKALHIQSVLAFYDAGQVPSRPTAASNKEDKD